MEKIRIEFAGGESRDSFKESQGVNYMLGTFRDEDDNEHELYAEVDVAGSPYEIDKSDWDDLTLDEQEKRANDFDNGGFDAWSYSLLKAEILRQADKYGFTEDDLIFD